MSENSYNYLGCINVVDASQFLTAVDTTETIVKQLETCDWVYINKIDLVSEEEKNAIIEKVLQIHPEVDYELTSYFKGFSGFLGKTLTKRTSIQARPSSNTPENKPKTISVHFNEMVDKETLESFMQALLPYAYRIKGFVYTNNQWFETHGVGKAIDFYETESVFEESTLVVISKIGPEIIRKIDSIWRDHFGYKVNMKN